MIDDPLLLAWLTGRSIARRLPMPVADHGGYRIDTRNVTEDARWVFPFADRRITALADTISTSRMLLKACASVDELTSVLPPGWHVDAEHHFMRSDATPTERPLPLGYVVEFERDGRAGAVRILAPDGTLAASGHCAETAGAFVYDRIETMPDHRRKGLGHFVMGLLFGMKVDSATPQLLVATEAGRSLYSRLGWDVLSPYATASLKTGPYC